MTLDVEVCGRCTKSEAAEKLGLVVYDTALPQEWLDETVDTLNFFTGTERSRLYDTVVSGTVWCYDGNMFGSPRPLTVAAMGLLTEVDSIKGTRYIDDTLTVLDIQDV